VTATVTCERDLVRVKLNQHAEYLGHLVQKLLSGHTDTQTYRWVSLIAPRGPKSGRYSLMATHRKIMMVTFENSYLNFLMPRKITALICSAVCTDIVTVQTSIFCSVPKYIVGTGPWFFFVWWLFS